MSHSTLEKRRLAHARKRRVRFTLRGTNDRPRANVFRSLKYITVQIIDDSIGKTLVTASDHDLDKKTQALPKTERAHAIGVIAAKKALEQKISTIMFDRGAYRYHGRVKAIADGMREGGLSF